MIFQINLFCSNKECVSNTVQVTCYKDKDKDGYGSSISRDFTGTCSSYNGYDYVLNNNDCNDNLKNQNPTTDWYLDNDGDGFAFNLNSAQIYNQCARPNKHKMWHELESEEDCDDTIYSETNDCSIPIEDNLCTGNFQIITEDNIGNPIEDITILENKQSRTQTTDSFGQTTFDYQNIDCHEDITFTATCSDSTQCGIKKDDIDDDFDSITFDCSKCIDDKKDLSFDRQSLKITDSQIIINVSSIGYSGDLMKISFKNPVNLESSNKYKIAFILDEKQLNSEIFQLPDLLLMKSHSVYLYP